MGTEYYTHRRKDGRYQALEKHLEGVASKESRFASGFGAGEHAYRAGMLHDIGKYSARAQRRQLEPETTTKTDHSTAGAQEAVRLHDNAAAFAIVGHHGGLPNLGGALDKDNGTLRARQRKLLTDEDDPSFWRDFISVKPQIKYPDWIHAPFSAQFYIRMLFSCLVDANYLDTEAFLQSGKSLRRSGAPLAELQPKLQAYIGP